MSGPRNDATAESAEGAEKDLNVLTGQVIGAAIDVHRALGPGLLESTYEICLARELAEQGVSVERQKPLPVLYKGRRIDGGYRIDLLVEQRLIVELKTVAKLEPVHDAQILTYLRLSGHPLGLLINFNVSRLRQGIKRFVNDYHGPTPRPPRPPR